MHFLNADFLLWLAKTLIKVSVGGGLLVVFYWLVGKMSESAKTFWVGVFSDGGVPSFSRVATGLIVVVALGWITYIVYQTRVIPDVGGVVLLASTLYGVNVAGSAAAKFAAK